jgi:hypothetical protein
MLGVDAPIDSYVPCLFAFRSPRLTANMAPSDTRLGRSNQKSRCGMLL